MMRAVAVCLLFVLCLSSLCAAAFTNSYEVTDMDENYSPVYLFYSNDALFIIFQSYVWGSQPILSKIDPNSGDILFNLTIPFTRCYPCAPIANGLQVNENFAIVTVENGTLWELFTIDLTAAEPSILGSFTPSTGGFVETLLADGQNTILIINELYPLPPATYLVSYDSTGATVTGTLVQAPKIEGVSEVLTGAINLTPGMSLACAEITNYQPPYQNVISFETTTGKIEDAINNGWGYYCPIISVSTATQGVCFYFSISDPATQELWCWNYSAFPSLFPAAVASFTAAGAVYDGVADDSGNFIGCYYDGTSDYLVQYAVNYEESTYNVLATAPLKGYYCQTLPAQMRQVLNYRISSTLQQVAQLVTSHGPNGYQTSVLLVNYDNTASSANSL